MAPSLSVTSGDNEETKEVVEETVCEDCTCDVEPVQVLIEIDTRLMTKEQRDTLFEIEKKLLTLGISFDTGFGGGMRHWEFDWSLKGPIKVIPKKEKVI